MVLSSYIKFVMISPSCIYVKLGETAGKCVTGTQIILKSPLHIAPCGDSYTGPMNNMLQLFICGIAALATTCTVTVCC